MLAVDGCRWIRLRGVVVLWVVAAMAACATVTSAAELKFLDGPDTGSLSIREGSTTNVLTYRFGDQLKPGVDPKHTRSCYIHPLYSLDGEPLTDDFPVDHLHHRGVFWTWPVIKVRGKVTQTWAPHDPPLRQEFVRWAKREVREGSAIFTAECRWVLDKQEEVARERTTVRVAPLQNNTRPIDVEIAIEAVGGPLTLQGTLEGKKGYGGFSFRGAPDLKGATILTDSGLRKNDIVGEPHAWVDLSTTDSGVAILVSRDHPSFPPGFLARNSYAGYTNVSWPGMTPVVLEPGKPVTLRYRLLVHRGRATATEIGKAFEQYNQGATAKPSHSR